MISFSTTLRISLARASVVSIRSNTIKSVARSRSNALRCELVRPNFL
ncbi:50S ribosomal protein L17 [Listeria monocytogenes]|nr:50S ribosomal protein L17 [Listeria monocytogenes]GAT39613.1 50S ribosomal protein L17 [Listeria monocytogenes]GAT41857.1 50S ribosomal protein L17 [Listeria monocytogenes]